MRKIMLQVILVVSALILTASTAFAHCEIPCGIYDDEARINMIEEDITTIEKSMKEILRLQKESPVNYNQLVRWIMNKEQHADRLQEIVSQYFLTQRIKIGAEKYAEKLSLLHKMLVYGMKAKQTTDLPHVKTLRSLLKDFHDLYFAEHN
ncbi:MAG: superoxide dismutase [Deltaproteobacteria bacterium]|nr:superoxide dismutase [Deltaproteobacteria bacterium]